MSVHQESGGRTYQNNQRSHSAIEHPPEPVIEVASDRSQEHFFCQERQHKGPRKRPTKYTANSEPHNSLGGPDTTLPVHEGRESKHGGIHGKTRGQICRRGMVHTRTRNHSHKKIYRNPGVHGPRDCGIQPRLACRTEKGQEDSKEVEFSNLAVDERQQTSNPYDHRMQSYVCPASDRVLGRVFPCLQPMAMVYVMCRLPVVKHLIAILDGREGSGDDVGDKEYVECNDGFELRTL